MSTALAIVKDASASFDAAPANAWFATYDPEGEVRLSLHFKRDLKSGARHIAEVGQDRKRETGAEWYTIDGEPYTIENIEAIGRFAVLLSTYHVGPGYGYWVNGQKNIKPLEAMFSDIGDTTSAKKLRDTFPNIFAPPVVIAPAVSLPAPQPRRRKRWYWPFS